VAVPRAKANSDEALLMALACGATVENAARSAGLSPRTAHRRLASPEFKRRLAQTRTDFVQRATAMVTAGNLEAGKTLIGLLDASIPPAVRLGAARALFEVGLKLRQGEIIEQRLAALEAQVLAQESPAIFTKDAG
jgi:hypothetical protein